MIFRLRSYNISYPDTKHTGETWRVLPHDVSILTGRLSWLQRWCCSSTT